MAPSRLRAPAGPRATGQENYSSLTNRGVRRKPAPHAATACARISFQSQKDGSAGSLPSAPSAPIGGSGMPTEKELDRSFETAIHGNDAFRAWFLSQTTHGSNYADLVITNSRHPWGKVRVMLADPDTGALGFQDREGETDILLVFGALADGWAFTSKTRRQAEHSRPISPSSTPHAQSTGATAKNTATTTPGRRCYWRPGACSTSTLTTAREFNTRIAHEDVALFVPAFGT